MASGTITENGPTGWVVVESDDAHLALKGDFNGAELTLEEDVDGIVGPVFNSAPAAGTHIILSAPDDLVLRLKGGDRVRWNCAGGTAPNIAWKITRATPSYTA